MKAKKGFMGLVAVSLVLVFAGVSFGAMAFYECKVAHVGSTTGYNIVHLKSVDGTVDYGWYTLGGAKGKELLATALTAFSMNQKVLCQFDNGVMGSLYLIYIVAN